LCEDGSIPAWRASDREEPGIFQEADQPSKGISDYLCRLVERELENLFVFRADCYVLDDCAFSSRTNSVGTRVGKPTKLSEFKLQGQMVYMADNEDDDWRPIIENKTRREIAGQSR